MSENRPTKSGEIKIKNGDKGLKIGTGTNFMVT